MLNRWVQPHQPAFVLAKRRATHRLGELITVAQKDAYLAVIDATEAKILAINGFTSAMGPGLVGLLGNYTTSWNSSYQQMIGLAQAILSIKESLLAGDLIWSVDKDSTLAQWTSSVNNLVTIMQAVTEPGGGTIPPPGGGGGGGTTPPPGGTTTQPSYTAYYVVGGVAGTLLVGSVLYLIFK
jgi:hypothetical protein